MKPEIEELIRAEQRRDDFSYVKKQIQGGRIRPSTFIHEVTMPIEIYEELKLYSVIDHEYIERHRLAFFELKGDRIVVSFRHLYNCEDFHRLVDRFIIIKYMGHYPITRTGVSKMNFDKIIEYVQLVKIKPNQKA